MKRERSYISSFKLALEIIIFIAVMAAAYVFIGNRYAEAASKNNINAWTKSRYDEFYALEDNTVDMVFIGSSHSYCTFDPENFDSVFGTLSWQLGTPLQNYDTSYFVLKEVYKTQRPKVVVLELYWDVMDDEFDMQQADSFLEAVDDGVKAEYIDTVFPVNEKVKYEIEPIRYQQDYFAYETSEMEKYASEKFGVAKPAQETNGVEYYLAKGYTYCDTVIPESEYDLTNQFKGLDGEDWEPNAAQVEYIMKFADLCREMGSEVVFVTAPIANVSMEWIENYDSIHEKIAAIAEEAGVKYLDFNIVNRDEGLFALENFRDDAHLNDSGVKIADAYFADWLRNNTDTFGNNNG